MDVEANKILKFEPATIHRYSFFALYNNSSGYGSIYYREPTFKLKQPYLKSSFVNNNGEVGEKKLWDDVSKVVTTGYDYIITNDSLIAFYEDIVTGKIGLIKQRL